MFISHKIKVISKDDNDIRDDFYCKICQFPFLTKDDFMVRDEYFCCYECYLTYAEARKKEWKKGWRPKQEVVDSYISNRIKLYEKEK